MTRLKHIKKTILFIFIVSLLSSCTDSKKYNYALDKTNNTLLFPLDTKTINNPFCYSLYTDDNNTTYFTFQNRSTNDILFYNINNKELEFRITAKIEGNNGVGLVSGYYIHNLDSIYLTNLDIKEISLINKDGIVLDKYSYDEDLKGNPLSLFDLTAAYYKPAQIIGRTLYLYSGPDRYVENAPVSITLDIDQHIINALPFNYPSYPGSETKLKKYGLENAFSRCYDGKHFVYSFYYDENIYITSPAHDSIQKIKVKSNYFPKVQLPDELTASPKDFCLNAWYGNLIYDKYRNVYYRIAYPPSSDLDIDIKPIELENYGRKNFSIIILDENFKILGETLFPDFIYNSKILFVAKEGLYISDSHYLNPNFDDDILSFRLFQLKH